MYTPLKVTTDYSLLKSLIKIDDLISFSVDRNITSCAICDDNLYGSLEFYTKCSKNNIKPIIGLTVYINNLPIYLYAKNYDGYKNLLKIHTIIHEREVNFDDLKKYQDNLVVILPYNSNSLFENLLFFDYLYIGYSTQFEKNNAKILSDNTIFVNDLRALFVDDIKYLEYLDKLRKDKVLDYSYNYYFQTDLVDLKEIDEFVSLFDLKMPINNRYIPKFRDDSKEFLYTLAFKGLEKRLNGVIPKNYLERLNYELDIISKMGFVDYFLIVYDYVLYAKKHGILVGPGRGSAAGSLVSYSIGITEIDPIKYDLLFERFLNPSRVTMPDIDIDFDAYKREEVINYVKEKYGVNKVAPGITFNTLKSKLVLREVGKLFNINSDLIDKFVKVIDGSKNLKDNLENGNVSKYLNNYKELNNLYKVAMRLEGLKKNISTHAAGVVISSVDLDEVIPIYKEGDTLLTGVAMEYLESVGLLKMDFLGLKNLSVISNILEKIGKDKLKNINLEDKSVYNLFASGKTDGIFQFETPTLKNLIIKLKPTCFNDLVASIALGRPGPKGHVEEFIRRKNHLEEVTYLHPDLESILKETYGVMLYQEQIINILVKIGGYSYSDADNIRRAISKKKSDVIESEKEKFVSNVVKRGYDKKMAEELFNGISNFASYGFNKSHSVAYSLIAYEMAYLKVYYPAYFITEFLDNKDKSSYYFAYLKQKGIKFYKPSVNNKKITYDIEGNSLFMPLSIIKNISKDVSIKILGCKGEKYLDYFDFLIKTKDFLTSTILESLIHAGALDCFNINHQTLINNMESVLNYISLVGDDVDLIKKPSLIEYPEYKDDYLRSKELESFGFFVTNHPITKYSSKNFIKVCNIEKFLFKKIKVAILVENIRVIKTKKGEDMAFLTGSDETGMFDFILFPKNFKEVKNINNGDVLCLYGEVTKRFDKINFIVNNINKLEG